MCDVDVRNEVVRICATQHEYLDRLVGLSLTNERDQVAEQRRPKKIHGRAAIATNTTAPSWRTLSVANGRFMGSPGAVT